MSKRLRKFVASLLLLSILLLYMPIAVVSGGQGQLNISAQQYSTALTALSEYLTGHTDWAGRMLEKHCYQPSVSTSTWQHYPAVRKIATAYTAAEAANPGIGGDMLLALLSKSMAQQYEAVKQERSLIPYLKMQVSDSSCLEFRNVSEKVFFSDLPYKVSEAIKTIADYCTRGPLGSPQAVIRFILKDNPNYNEDAAEGFLIQSESNVDALMRAFSFVPREAQVRVLKQLVAKLIPHNEAARYERSLQPFMPETVTGNSLVTSIYSLRVEPQPNSESNPSSWSNPLIEPGPTPLDTQSNSIKPAPYPWLVLPEQSIGPPLILEDPRAPISPFPRVPNSVEIHPQFAERFKEPDFSPGGHRTEGLGGFLIRRNEGFSATSRSNPNPRSEVRPIRQPHPPRRVNPSPRPVPPDKGRCP